MQITGDHCYELETKSITEIFGAGLPFWPISTGSYHQLPATTLARLGKQSFCKWIASQDVTNMSVDLNKNSKHTASANISLNLQFKAAVHQISSCSGNLEILLYLYMNAKNAL